MGIIDDYRQATALLRAHRYETIPDDQKTAMWQELNQITTELCHHLDAEHVIPQSVLDAGKTAAGLDHGITANLQASSELVLTTLIQQHIEGEKK